MKLGFFTSFEDCEQLSFFEMMGDLARQAFNNGNYEKASEMYDRAIKDKGANVDLLLGLADSLANCGKIHEALNAYVCAYSCGLPKLERLESFVDALTDIARSKGLRMVQCAEDFYSCVVCQGVMVDPVTLTCGHSFSKNCIAFNDSQAWECKKCGKSYSHGYLSQLKTNVAISTLVEKWWKKEIEATKLRTLGNEQFQQGNNSAAIESYTLALKQVGQPLAALNDAENVSRICPSWPKAYFRKGAALVNLGRYEEAIIAYLHCIVLDPSAIAAKHEVKKLIHNLLLKHPSVRKSHSMHSNIVSQNFQNNPLEQQRQLTSCEGILDNGDSSDSICSISNMDDDSSEDECLKNWNRPTTSERRSNVHENNMLHKLVQKFFCEVDRSKEAKTSLSRRVDPSLVEKCDFECPLCMRLLWEPVTTPCGHTFCRMCLDRCFDHQPNCPLCKTMLSTFIAERAQCTTEFIEFAIGILLPQDYSERKKIYEDEMEELANAGKDPEHVIPLFVCTIAYPTVPCPLHIFEPRYRLMVRQCMESGTRQFGMCAYVGNEEDSIANYGTMLEIRDVQYFPDGRSVVDTIGIKRFKILRKSMRDGYHTGAVEFLQDEKLEGEAIEETKDMHDRVRKISEAWFAHLPNDTKRRILQHFGAMPDVEAVHLTNPNGPSWFWWMLAVLPLDPRAQIRILGMTSLHQRLGSLHRILLHLRSTNIM